VGTAPAPAPTTSGLEPRICGLLCWIPVGPVPLIASIVFLVVDPYKENKFIRFHAFQNLFFAAAAVAISIALMIVGAILAMAGPLALLMIPIWLAYCFGVLGVMIYMCVKAYGMESPRLPFIGELAAKQAGV
jgi:uncharacterized membrane protein